MEINKYKHIYFIGIGGIGMSALARYCLNNEIAVYGYDKTRTALCVALEEEGAQIIYKEEAFLVPELFKDLQNSLVIYTPAISASNSISQTLKLWGHNLTKRAAFLGSLSESFYTIAVAGTHGKTTTSCLLAHLFKEAKMDFTAILGGISTNLNSNYYCQKGRKITGKSILITEADEFDESFLQLSPELAIVTSTDADHLDIYGEEDKVRESYQKFANLVKDTLVQQEFVNLKHGKSYKYGKKSEYAYQNITIENNSQFFDINAMGEKINNIKAGLPGEHNIQNSTAAAAIAILAEIDPKIIGQAIKTYQGVQRRFEKIIDSNNNIVIDDYAHHPTEIRALVNSVKEIYPNRKITMVFQPHLYSRTRDFMQEFAQELDRVDETIIMPIYPAREEPIEGITSKALLKMMKNNNGQVLTQDATTEYIKRIRPNLLLITGAGDINLLRNPIKEIYDGR